jgi:hypothetical protein
VILSAKGEVLRPSTIGVVLLLTVLPAAFSSVRAAESGVEAPSQGTTWDWLLTRRQQVSRQVTQLGRTLDEWMAGEGVGDQLNETYLSVRFNQLYGTFDNYNSKVKIGGRLDLPSVSERWKLIFESDIQELNTLQENVLDGANSGDSVGGIRYQDETDSGWNLSHDVGIRSLAPTDPFYRFRARYSLPLGSAWSVGLDQKLWYYDSRGWGFDTEVAFTRELGVDRFIRIASEANFQDSRDTSQFSQTAALYRTLGADETLGYEFGILGVNKPSIKIDDYYAQMPYRRAIYEDWLFLEVTPQVLVSRIEDWRPQPRLLVNLEMLFFDF